MIQPQGRGRIPAQMSTGRQGKGLMAVLVPNGKVLVAAGHGSGTSTLSSAELYDPTTGTWTNTGSLSYARENYSLTLLNDGKVLATGGYINLGSYQYIAELYDPATGTWRNTGSLNTTRSHHTTTLLPNGRVLVAGGGNPSGSLSSVELYNPGPRIDLIKAVKPSFSGLSLGTNYALQLSGDLSAWTNHGLAFTATNTSMIYPQYWDVNNWDKLFFRLQVSP